MGDEHIRNLANIITASRILFGICIVFIEPLSFHFWVLYICGGISDMIDGPIARKRNQQTSLRAVLDSIADFVFIMAILFQLLQILTLPTWFLIYVYIILIIRFVNIIFGFIKYHTFVAIHTYANRGTGSLLFLFPVLYIAFGLNMSGFIIGCMAFLSAFEESVIIIWNTKLDRNCRSIFLHKSDRLHTL